MSTSAAPGEPAPGIPPAAAQPPPPPSGAPVAEVIAAVAAINAEISSPVASTQIAAAILQLTTVQSLATAIQDAVNDLRSHTTTQLAAVGAAAAQLVATGDLKKFRDTLSTLELATKQSQQRLESLLALAQRSLQPATAK